MSVGNSHLRRFASASGRPRKYYYEAYVQEEEEETEREEKETERGGGEEEEGMTENAQCGGSRERNRR